MRFSPGVAPRPSTLKAPVFPPRPPDRVGCSRVDADGLDGQGRLARVDVGLGVRRHLRLGRRRRRRRRRQHAGADALRHLVARGRGAAERALVAAVLARVALAAVAPRDAAPRLGALHLGAGTPQGLDGALDGVRLREVGRGGHGRLAARHAVEEPARVVAGRVAALAEGQREAVDDGDGVTDGRARADAHRRRVARGLVAAERALVAVVGARVARAVVALGRAAPRLGALDRGARRSQGLDGALDGRRRREVGGGVHRRLAALEAVDRTAGLVAGHVVGLAERQRVAVDLRDGRPGGAHRRRAEECLPHSPQQTATKQKFGLPFTNIINRWLPFT